MAIGWKLICLGLVFSLASVSAAGKCKVCESTDEKCTTDPGSIASTNCASDYCFTSVGNNGKVQRGCVDETNTCDTINCAKCTITAEEGCNKDIPFTCRNCDSSVNANCSKVPDIDTIVNQICGSGIKKCFTQIKDDKHTERRCATKTDEACATGKKCTTCETTGCNKDIYPADRRRCYQCESSSKCANPSTNTAEILSLPCTLYDEAADKCFFYGASDTDMTRGCVSNTTEFAKCKDNCIQCDTDNCNNAAFKRTQSLKCIQCKSDDANCAWGHADSEAKDCVNQIEYWQSESCYTNKVEAMKVDRGCLHDAAQDFDCSKLDTCTSCNTTSACNKVDAMEYSCYKCRSDENSKCALAWIEGSYTSDKCRNPVTQADQGCYTDKWNDIIIRSCLVDADVKTRKLCLDDNYKLCDSCLTANCNMAPPPSSAHAIALGSGLLALSIFMSRIF